MGALRDFVVGDWYIAIPMFLMSITGIMFVIWRLLLNINGNTDMNEFLPLFQSKLDRDGVDGALKFCKARTDVIPRRLFVAGLEQAKQGAAAMRRSMANAAELEIVPDLNFLLPSILAIAKIATMVGLLGTVISMINTFQKIGVAREDPTAHSAAIGLAVFATALGLVPGLPLVFAHVLFKAWVAKFEVRMKSAAQKLLLLVQAKQAGLPLGKAASAPAAAAKPGIDPSAMSPRK